MDHNGPGVVEWHHLERYPARTLRTSVLSDGDVVKIGELTSIIVKFDVTGCKGEDNIGKTRRNPRRGAAGRGQRMVELMVIDEDFELGLGFKDKLGDMAGSFFSLKILP
ncbi:hypothetical protein Fot_29117 [Forsythia ovata]|uniref:Uncharacterized protein n=1 Tax=Forsythia ovata TaxID=205694 RepID=A0ABD1TR10_9LAMI